MGGAHVQASSMDGRGVACSRLHCAAGVVCVCACVSVAQSAAARRGLTSIGAHGPPAPKQSTLQGASVLLAMPGCLAADCRCPCVSSAAQDASSHVLSCHLPPRCPDGRPGAPSTPQPQAPVSAHAPVVAVVVLAPLSWRRLLTSRSKPFSVNVSRYRSSLIDASQSATDVPAIRFCRGEECVH